MEKEKISNYLKQMKRRRIIPNFWSTFEYLSIQDMELINNGKVMWIQEDEWTIFPPIPLYEKKISLKDCPPLKIWSDFENYSIGENLEFLDWEYVYDSNEFLNMRGGKWEVFRKNSRKWPNRNNEWSYSEVHPSQQAIEKLLIKWLEPRKKIEDSESLMWFVFNGELRKFMYHKDKLIGITVGDENEPYIMFRYCITDPDEPFLDEFMRLLFYRSHLNKLVIDGGVLGNPGLERFKDKLNPIKKRAIYSKVISEG